MIKKGDHATYIAFYGGARISAIVRCAHRDGSATIQAHFVLDDHDMPTGSFIGYKYRISQDALTPLMGRGQ